MYESVSLTAGIISRVNVGVDMTVVACGAAIVSVSLGGFVRLGAGSNAATDISTVRDLCTSEMRIRV